MNVGKRVYSVKLQIQLPMLLMNKIDTYAAKHGISRRDVVIEALMQFFRIL